MMWSGGWEMSAGRDCDREVDTSTASAVWRQWLRIVPVGDSSDDDDWMIA